MTKITKPFAIIICIALMLGMTVMAAPMTRPTLVIDYEDFESYANIAAYQANATNMDGFASAKLTGGVAAFRTTKGLTLGNKNYNRFYRILNNNWEIVDDGTGNKVAKMKAFNADAIDGQFVFALDDSWTYEESVADVKDLVFSVDVTPIDVQYRGDNGQVPVRTRVADAGMFYTGTTNAGALRVLSETSKTFTLMHAQTSDPTVAKFSAATGNSAATDRGYDDAGSNGAAFNYPKGTKLSMAMVLGPYSGTNPWLADRSIFNYNHLVNVYMTRHTEMVSVDSFVYGNMRGQIEQLDNFKVYELSRNPEHFYVETVNTEVVDNKIEIIFSQPVSYYGSESAVGSILNDPLVAGTTILKGTTTYTGGTHFTGVVSDRVVEVDGNKEVVGVLTLDVSGITLGYSEGLTITLPTNIRNIARTAMPASANRVITATTPSAPTFDLVISPVAETLPNKLKKYELTTTNTTDRAENAIIFFGVYDSGGNIQSYSFVKANFASIGAQEALSLSTQAATGNEIRAYACGEKEQIAALATSNYGVATPIVVPAE